MEHHQCKEMQRKRMFCFGAGSTFFSFFEKKKTYFLSALMELKLQAWWLNWQKTSILNMKKKIFKMGLICRFE